MGLRALFSGQASQEVEARSKVEPPMENRVADEIGQEERAEVSMSDATMSGSDATISEVLNGQTLSEGVTLKEAMSLPGVWAAINFLSAAMASLPIEVFEKTEGDGGDNRVKGGIALVLSIRPVRPRFGCFRLSIPMA